jgi:hypothetical protein
MKKSISILSLIVVTLLMSSCGGTSEENEMISLPDPPKDLKYLVEGNDLEENLGASDPIGTWTGKFGNNSIVLVLENNSNGVVTGYNEVAGNKRAVSGTCIWKGGEFVLELKEPGDHKWDGVFKFIINDDDQRAIGSWKMNKGKSENSFDLEKTKEGESSVSSNSNIDGDLSNYMSAVPGEYLFEMEKREDAYVPGYNESIKVKFKFTKSIDVAAGTGYNRFGPSISAIVLDKDNNKLEFSLSTGASADLATYLKKGSGEEWLTLNVSGQGSISSKEDAVKLLEKYKKGKKIRFNSEIIEEKFDSESSSSSSESNEVSSSSGDCDEFLKGYEKFMGKYIAIIKKMENNPNDMSVMTDYTSMMAEATEWAEKTADCAADATFAAKFAAIQMKIANAASGM